MERSFYECSRLIARRKEKLKIETSTAKSRISRGTRYSDRSSGSSKHEHFAAKWARTTVSRESNLTRK